MARCATLVTAALALLLLLTPPGLAWYKPAAAAAAAAGPRHYSVGRAAGLLSNIRRSPSARRSESPVPVVETVHPQRTRAFPELLPSLRTLAVCVKDITPNLRSCERLLDSQGTFQCKADVFLSLREADCRST